MINVCCRIHLKRYIVRDSNILLLKVLHFYTSYVCTYILYMPYKDTYIPFATFCVCIMHSCAWGFDCRAGRDTDQLL